MEQDTVRRCQRCGAPAVIIVNRWESRLFGLLRGGHPAQTDHRCQACGASFSLRPYLLLRFGVGAFIGVQLTVVGGITLIGAVVAVFTQGLAASGLLLLGGTLLLGFGLAVARYLAGPQVRAWRNPRVPGARVPELRLGPPEDHRTCSCGRPARAVRVVAHRTNGLPTGTDTTYACAGCGREFEVPDLWAVVFRTGAAVFLGAVGLLLASLTPVDELSGSNVTCLAVLGLGTLAATLLAVFGAYRRSGHPRTTVIPT